MEARDELEFLGMLCPDDFLNGLEINMPAPKKKKNLLRVIVGIHM